jgi:O-antigen ligase
MLLVLLRRPGMWVAAAVVVVLTLVAFNVVDVPASLDAQLREFGDVDVRDAHITPLTFSTIERLAHWQAAIRMTEASPWLGVGFGNYAAAYPDFRLLLWENALGHAHNYYLNILAETGLIGLLTYLALWATVIIVTWRAARQPATCNLQSAICVGILGAWAHLAVHHAFDNLYVANMHLLIGAYLGFVIAASRPAEA